MREARIDEAEPALLYPADPREAPDNRRTNMEVLRLSGDGPASPQGLDLPTPSKVKSVKVTEAGLREAETASIPSAVGER